MGARLFTVAFLAAVFLLQPAPVQAQEPATPTIYFYREGQAVPIVRPGILTGEPKADAKTLLLALLAGPSPEERAIGLASPLPPGTELLGLEVSGDEVTVDLYMPLGFLREELDAYRSDAIVEQVVKTLHPLGLHHVHVRVEDEDGKLVPVSAFLPRLSVPVPMIPPNDDAAPDRLGAGLAHVGQPPSFGQGQPSGALSGKTVWLSAGHGWYWSDTLSRWNTQRGNNYGLVEDFSNAEAVNYYLARYLWNAGANVWLVRERAMTEHQVIVDDDDGAPAYTETGPWVTSTYTGTGYNDGDYRYVGTVTPTLTATATWTPNLPDAGWYAIWAWYRHGTNRPTDARYEIHHSGGVTTVSISQEVHGQTWRYLGEYYLDAGTAGHVTLLNASNDPGQAVVADAMRFGGGLGSIVEPGGTSNEPRWEEAAKYWAQYQGAPPEAYPNDVVARPLYAEWESAKGYPDEAEDAVYISWHTNAGGGTGSESYIHDTEPTTGSVELQDWVHAELIHDLRAAWNPTWRNRGQKSADFGEVRELSIIPGVLLEVAFHDTEYPGDADDLREPVFRQIAARSVFQGIVKYHAARESTPIQLLPEPPTHLLARHTGSGEVTLTWTPPPCCDNVVGDAATAYKVYQSADGRAFDNGIETANPGLILTNLPPATLRFFRVTALNEGGESFPTPVVAVRTPVPGRRPSFLIVDGFDRLDQTALIPQWESPALGTDQRMFLERMNRYDYTVEHAQALSACGIAFDGAVNEAVAAGDVWLDDYHAVDWFVGEDSASEAALSGTERALLAAYLDGGGGLLISGAEIGYDLVELGRDPAFYHDYLRTNYLGDDAQTYAFVGVSGGPFEGLAGSFDDSTGGTYDVGYPDRLGAPPGSTVVLSYVGGTADGAALAYDADFRLVHFGFPLETVTDETVRTDLFCAAADYVLPPQVAGVALSPDRNRTSKPGQAIAYTHTLTNTGDAPDTFYISHTSSQGWSVTYESPLSLGSGQAATLIISITVPLGTISGTVDTTLITATSQADPHMFDAVRDTTTVDHVAGVSFSPNRIAAAKAGQVITYHHYLKNTGNWPDTFHIAHASSQDWPVTYPTSVMLDNGQMTTLMVSINVPADAPTGTKESTVLTATSQFDAAVVAVLADTTVLTRVSDIPLAGVPRLINPSFEQGLGQSAWLVNTSGGNPVFAHRDILPAPVEPHSGDWVAWLGGYTPGIATTTALTQVVALPPGESTLTLALSWLARTEAPMPSAADSLTAAVYDQTGTLQTTLLIATGESPTNIWQTETFDLAAFAGKMVLLAFRAVGDDMIFFVDDVRLHTDGPAGPDEFRALWVDAYHIGIKSPHQIDELIETAQAGNVNALVVQVRRRGDTYYPSALDPWAPDADPSFDALAYLLDRAHAAGIEVHAWATTLAIWGGDTPPDAPEHTFNVHGPDATGLGYWLMPSYTGEERASNIYYLDPGHPDVVDYTVAIYAELAANYDVDGLHLDRVRYAWQDWGYNPVSLSRFQAQTGRSDLPEPSDGQWLQWRRDQLSALVRKIYLTTTAINPRLRLSAALSAAGGPPSKSYPWETRTPYTHQLQDWRRWLEEGTLDLGLSMTYKNETAYASQFDGWIAWQKDHQYGRRTAIGTGLYLNAVEDSMAQWLRARQPTSLGNQALGIAGYSYATPSSEEIARRDFVNAAVTQVYSRPASLPAIPWKDTPDLGHLMGRLTLGPPFSCPLDHYPLTLTGPKTLQLRTDGSGWFGSVDLPPGEYLLSAAAMTPNTSISLPVTVVAGAVTEQDIILPVYQAWDAYLPIILKQPSP